MADQYKKLQIYKRDFSSVADLHGTNGGLEFMEASLGGKKSLNLLLVSDCQEWCILALSPLTSV